MESPENQKPNIEPRNNTNEQDEIFEPMSKESIDSDTLLKEKISSSEKIIDSFKKVWKESGIQDRFVIGLLASTMAYTAALPVIEYGKRKASEGEYKKAKDLLKEYVINNKESIPDIEKYNKAVELFGEDNLFWFDEKDEYIELEKDSKDTKRSDESISRINERLKSFHENRGSLMHSVYDAEDVDFFTKNKYVDELKNIQETIKNLDIENQDSVKISYEKDVTLGFTENMGLYEKFDTLKEETFEKIIYETYPKNWFLGEVKSISFLNKKDDNDDTNQYGKNIEAAAEMSMNDEAMNFFDYKDYFRKDQSHLLFEVLSHEVAHANDWSTNGSLKPKERIDLLIDVASRLDQEDRFYSYYVEESIITKDPQNKLYTKSTEYWAEICGEYFTNGKENLSPKDVELIERIIKIKDPEYSVERAIQKRKYILNNEVFRNGDELKDNLFTRNDLYTKKDNTEKESTVLSENWLWMPELEDYFNKNEKAWDFLDRNKEEIDSINRKNGYDYWDVDVYNMKDGKHTSLVFLEAVKLFKEASSARNNLTEVSKRYGSEVTDAKVYGLKQKIMKIYDNLE